MRLELCNHDDGPYVATTATGCQYEFDLTAKTLKRQIAATAPIVDVLDGGFSRLRRDGEIMELLMLETCRVGASASYWLQVRSDHMHTLRRTLPGVCIEPMTKHGA